MSDHAGGIFVEPAVFLEDEGYRLHLAGLYPGIDQLVPGMHLEGVGRIPLCIRVASTALALEPAPPATVALMISTSGYCFL